MARTLASLPPGSRITDYVSLGVLTKSFPLRRIQAVLSKSGKASIRQRELPAPIVVYYVVALALYMQSSYREVLRCLLEGLQWLKGPGASVTVAGKSGISQARTRLGWEPLKQLHDELVQPVAARRTHGAWYRNWRLVSLDGSTLEVADTAGNAAAFGRPTGPREVGAYPQVRFVSVIENGTHVLMGSQLEGYRISEKAIAKHVIPRLSAGMLCIADRLFAGYHLWKLAQSTGAELLWRVPSTFQLAPHKRLPDGSHLSYLYATTYDRRQKRNGILVRVIEYRLEGIADAEPLYRLITTILDHRQAPAKELAAVYPERWEIETALDELKTHLRGSKIILRSKTPDLVRQEFYGMMMAHYAIRSLMHEAALQGDVDPDRLSFLHAVRVVRRKLPFHSIISPSVQEGVSGRRS
jgi:hypothetical protein